MIPTAIVLGTNPDDGTGSPLRTGGGYINTNFENLAKCFGVCHGTAAGLLEYAIHNFQVTTMNRNDLFYLKLVEYAVPASGHYRHTIEVYVENSLSPETSGSICLKWSAPTEDEPLTGVGAYVLLEQGGSGMQGVIVIDWDQLTEQETYGGESFNESGLRFPTVLPPKSTGGGGGSELPIETGNFNADGSLDIIIANPVDGTKTCTIVTVADLKGRIKIKNKSAFSLAIVSFDSYNIDGEASGVLPTGGWCEIYPNVDEFITIGDFVPDAP